MKSEPKIWWIEKGSFNWACHESDKKLNGWGTPIKVISYEDYQKLEQDYKDLENSMQCLQRSILNDEIETCGECEYLKTQNEKLIKALEFYADKNNWYENGALGLSNHIIDEDLSQDDCLRWIKKHGGKRAREVLKEVRGDK